MAGAIPRPGNGDPTVEFQQIRYFLALAAELNFTQAAKRCGVSQPTLTRAIKKLEAELGGPLVRRERGRTHLTELGQTVLPRLEQALSLAELARSDALGFARMSTASLSLGVMCTIGPSRLIALVEHLGRHVPQLELKLRETTGLETINALLAGEFDVALVGLPEYPDGVVVHELYHERYMIAFPPGHRFARMEAVPLHELQGERYLERLNCEYMAFFDSAFAQGGVTCSRSGKDSADLIESLDVRYESEHEDWIQAMIVAGMGCAVVPEYMTNRPGLQMRPLVDPEVWRHIGVATVRGRPHTPVVKLFVELCQQMGWRAKTGASG